MDFTLPALGSITTSTGNSSGILGGWATVRTDRLEAIKNSGGNIAALATYQNDDFSAASNNVSITVNDAPAAAFTINTLRFNVAGASPGGLVLTVPGSGSGISTVTAGILVTPQRRDQWGDAQAGNSMRRWSAAEPIRP